MNIYKYLKLASGNLPSWIKLLGIWAMLIGRRRMIGIFFDPILACNFRCKMCYMSDSEQRKKVNGQTIAPVQLDLIKKQLFPKALKLQIGCSTEPTLYPDLTQLISDAKMAKVPYVALTTNGRLIGNGRVDLSSLAKAGLDELTLSIHGTTREIYEELMPGGNYDDLKKLTEQIPSIKKQFPDLKLRVNFTINSLNLQDLEETRFWSLWHENGMPDIIQLRPVQKLGNTQWTDFDLSDIKNNYHSTIDAIRKRCKALGIRCIAPDPENLDLIDLGQDQSSMLITEATYCYASPESIYGGDFTINDTFASYHKRKKTAQKLIKAIFTNNRKNFNAKTGDTKHLNYKVD